MIISIPPNLKADRDLLTSIPRHAIQPTYQSAVSALYERVKTKMSDLDAGMRKLVYLCFAVLNTRQSYPPNYAVQD